MTRTLLSFFAALVLSCGAVWAEDAAPAAAAPAPAAAPAADAKPAEAAAPAAAADAKPAEAPATGPGSETEKRIKAAHQWFGYTYVPYTDDDKKAWADAEAKLKKDPNDKDAKAVMDAKKAMDDIPYKDKAEKEVGAPNALNDGDNGWMMISTAIVLMMTIPGLALFYGGLVRKKNVLSTMMHSWILCGVITLLWVLFGFSWAFGQGPVGADGAPTSMAAYFGGWDFAMLKGVLFDPALYTNAQRFVINGDYAPTISFGVFCMFQLMFAIITPALISGAYAERIKFTGMLVFTIIWFCFAYLPMAHMVWGKNGLFNWGFGASDWAAFDFAGGTVVHISSGVAALMAAIFLGKRKGYPETPMPPHSLVLSVIGAALLWVGWYGFNAGSALGASGLSMVAFVNTTIATALASLSWPAAEWIIRGKPTVLGSISGAVAGLVAITPACGFVDVSGALWIGLIVGALCFTTTSYLKRALGYDDALDAFGVHGIGGMFGAVATGVFLNVESNPAIAALNPDLYRAIVGGQSMVGHQIKAVLITVVLSAVVATVGLLVAKFTVGLRVTPDEENEGLDLSQHGEEGYHGVG
jgi:Amt family ammonium transporter